MFNNRLLAPHIDAAMFKSMVHENGGTSILRGDHMMNGDNQPTVEFVDDINPGEMLNSITGLPSRAKNFNYKAVHTE